MIFTKKELEERKKYIGASECAAVLGMSRWQTQLEIWAIKTGQIIPEDISDKPEVWLGNELEEVIAKRFTKDTNKKVHRVNEAYVHDKYDFIRTHIDRKVDNENAILQIKTCSAWKSKEWEGEEIPQEYILQEYHELACTKYKKAYIYVLIGNHEFKLKEIHRDDKIINDIIKREVAFWNNFVLTKEMPIQISPNDGDVLCDLFPLAETGKEIILGDTLDKLKESRDALYQDNIALERQIDKIENEIKALIKDNEIGVGNKWRIMWKNIHKASYVSKEQDYRQLFYKEVKKGGK